MKIYCDSNLGQHDIFYWADKPFWVLCNNRVDKYWIKVSWSSYNGYYISYIDAEYVEDYSDELIWEAGLPSAHISHSWISENTGICPVFPIEVLTDAEFNTYMTDNDAKWTQERENEDLL